MSSNTTIAENDSGRIDAETITGPHDAHDARGNFYTYWRCERCGMETTDSSVRRNGCFRCGGDGR